MWFTISLLALLAPCPSQAEAHPWSVAEVRIENRFELLEGEEFGEAGAYERLDGEVVFHFDPEDPWLSKVVDIEFAPLAADGHVEAIADLMWLRPVESPAGVGTALVEVSNRGGKASLQYFSAGRGGSDPRERTDFGDGLLFERGVSLVWLGWQADVPDRDDRLRLRVPRARAADGEFLRGPVRADWKLESSTDSLALAHRNHIPYLPVPELTEEATLTKRSSRNAERKVVPRDAWKFHEDHIVGSFQGGSIYELVYTAQDPWVLGLGSAALAQFAGWLKDGEANEAAVENTVAVGISQTGRFLRHFLYQGFQDLGSGRRAFDGVMVLTAGAGRGSFNHRFGQPSRDAHQNSAFFYPTDLFPFSSRVQRDPVTGERDGLMRLSAAAGIAPKLFQVNTGYEYWGRAAALVHSSLDGAADVAPLERERLYHVRGTQHFQVGWPRSLSAERLESAESLPVLRGSPVNNLVVYRALMTALLDWVEFDVEPPASRIPTIADGSLVALDEYELPGIERLELPGVAEEAYRVDYGERWSRGIVDREPPVLGPAFPVLVPRCDRNGNEVSGVPTLETLVPLGSFLPFHLDRIRVDGQQALTDFYGSFLPLAPTPELAEVWGDSRDTLESLYGDEDGYMEAIGEAIDQLVEQRWLLPRDCEAMALEAQRRWRSLMGE